MSEAGIRTDIKNTIKTVFEAGVVYDYERLTNSLDEYISLFKTTIDTQETIRGWIITCSSVPLGKLQFQAGWRNTYNYTIRGYFGHDDATATEKTALKKALEVRDKLRDAASMTENDRDMTLIPQIEAFEVRLFGDVLCHVAEIRMDIEENG